MRGRVVRVLDGLVVVLALVVAVACSGKPEEKGKSETKASSAPGSDAKPSQLGQMKQAAEGFAAFGKAMEEAQKQGGNVPAAVSPVHFNQIMKFLPEDVGEGLKGEKPFGQTQSMGEFSTSEVRRRYASEGEVSKNIEVKIMDTGFAPMIVQPFFMMAKAMSNETTEGYQKGKDVGGSPAIEKFQNESKNGELTILVGKRFMVTISEDGFEDTKPILAVAAKMDMKGLEQLATENAAKPMEAQK
jgi:hypothetical protein